MITILLVSLLFLHIAPEYRAYDGLIVTTIVDGLNCEISAQNGDVLYIHYVGSIAEESATGEKGKVFDMTRRKPLKMTLGRGGVIDGWEQGLIGICVGEKRTLIIPPDLGYGKRGNGNTIPGGATLKFDIECVDIVRNKKSTAHAGIPEPNVFKLIDRDSDWLITYEEMLIWFMSRGEKLEKFRWHLEDKNRDGIVTWEEFSGLKGQEPPPKEKISNVKIGEPREL